MLLKAYGAHLIMTDPRLSSDGAILKARELYAQDPTNTFIPTSTTTRRTGGRITREPAGNLAADAGTRHAFCGRIGNQRHVHGNGAVPARSQPQHAPDLVSARLAFHGLEGMKYMPTSIVPEFTTRILPMKTRGGHRSRAYNGKTAGAHRGYPGGHLRRRRPGLLAAGGRRLDEA